MSHGPEHHIEHAEHASHAKHDPFDRRVTMTIAIVAAILACVTMLAHRAHNRTLLLQGEAVMLFAQAGIKHTETTNKWAFYQAQNIRSHFYQAMQEQLALTSSQPGTTDLGDKTKARWRKQVDKYEGNLPNIEKDARGLEEQTKEKQQQAQAKLIESHATHQRADRLDLGELGVELAVILCSVAVLTKRRGFWYAGMLSCLAGVLVAASGFFGLFMGYHH